MRPTPLSEILLQNIPLTVYPCENSRMNSCEKHIFPSALVKTELQSTLGEKKRIWQDLMCFLSAFLTQTQKNPLKFIT